jgi:hypothetical protein
MARAVSALVWSSSVVAAALPTLELSNAAVRVQFDGATGELLSLVSLLGTADDYLAHNSGADGVGGAV